MSCVKADVFNIFRVPSLPMIDSHIRSRTAIDLTIVVPVKDEENNILSLISEIHSVLEGKILFELIYIDDCSTDSTPLLLEKAKKFYPRLKVIRHKIGYGQSQAIITGIKAAKAAWIATLDGDGQNDPADILVLFSCLQNIKNKAAAWSMLVGNRVIRRDIWIKRVGSRFANHLRSAILKDNTPDTGCGLKVFSRAVFLEFPHFDHMHRYLPALMLLSGGQVISHVVNHRPRSGGCSHYGTLDRLWVGFFDLLGILWLQRRYHHPSSILAEEEH